MNPVNATALYVSASRSVLQCDPRDQQSLAELFKLLSFFRQSLSCLVCGNLLKDPVAPTNSSCQHYVCKACKGQKMTMKPSCSWCKNYEQFEDCKQVCILVECYRKLCEYVAVSPLAHQINSSIKDCPEVLDVLKEGLSLNESGPDESHVSLSLSLSHSPTPPAPEAECAAKQEASEEPPDPVAEAAACLPDVNGLQNDCSGTGLGELGNGGPSPVEEVGAPVVTCSSSGEGLNPHSFPSALPVCEAEASQELCAEGIDVCGLGEDIKHSDGPLLLSVEEVLRSLDPEPEPVPVTPQYPGQLGHPNGPLAEPTQASVAVDSRPSAPGHPQPPSSGISCSAATPRPASRPNRKRSRSESDSEKVQPLPIASIILGPSTAAVAPVAVKREAVVPAQPTATVTNGGMPKVGNFLLVSSKGIKKNPEHGPKKPYSKSRQGVPKTKDKTKDRLPGNSLESGSPAKVVLKKPQEKKGCKCGRATQNPSVLTCRGQRCPCYSNRKACLDCICRGCQNSYMANGEKKLEAFAVPEKALEQTRLTLGINVTSIAVRNAGASAGVLNMAAGSPVTSFLAASSHDDSIFDETLDMRF